MADTKHTSTPTPWFTDFEGQYIFDDKSRMILEIRGAGHLTEGQQKAMASRVVRCVNAHEQLVEALKAIYEETADYIRINNLGDVHHNRSMQLARTALKQAGGE